MELCKNLEFSENNSSVTDYQYQMKRLRERKDVVSNKFKEFLISQISDRSILIWGAVKRNDFFLEFAKKIILKFPDILIHMQMILFLLVIRYGNLLT